jgi:hypothetical protein
MQKAKKCEEWISLSISIFQSFASISNYFRLGVVYTWEQLGPKP